MADTKISDLPAAASVDGSELIPVVKLGTTQRVTPAQIKTYMGVSGVNTGDQDLSALALKATTVNGQPLSANVVITKSDVGLGNAENTSDADKPVSTATSTALSGKQATLVSGTNIKTINGNTLLGSGDLVVSGSGTVTSASVVSANGFAGTVATATTTPAITLTTSITGLLQGNGTAIAAAVAGTDIKTINSASLIGSGDIAVGTVTTASVATANGFAGSVATASTTPVITLTTSLTGLLKGNGTAMSVATAGTDYSVPAGTETLTNKRITVRVGSTTSSATPTINTDNVDIYKLTAQAADITSFTTNLSGTPTDGQCLIIQITGTAARTITWGASFEASTVALPTTTVTTDMLAVAFIWNTATSKWRCVAAI